MVENNEELKLSIGTEETQTFKPALVEIERIEVQAVGEKGAKKAICYVKHPDAEKLIQISAVRYINNDSNKVEVSGLWINKDTEGKLRKTSATANFLNFLKCKTLEELKGKKVEAVIGDTKYLVFKSY